MRIATAVFAVLLATASSAWATPIASRAALDAFLGGSAVNEDFETYAIASGNAPLGGSFDSSSIRNGQGPGLIVPDMEVSTTTGNVIWQADNYFSIPTKTLGSDISHDLTVNFTSFVRGFGVDLLNYGGFPSTYNLTVYGADDSTVIASVLGITFPSAVTPQFFGFEDALGIGGFRVDQIAGFGPVIDNVEFGTAVPEPGSLLLLGTGLAAAVRRARRRRQI